MEENKIITLRQPDEIADPLTEVLRNGARALLAQAVEAEVAEALAAHAHLTTDDGRGRVVRHGHMPERTIQTGIGPVAVRQPRVRDRSGTDGERIRFSSTLLPPYARRTKSLDALLPIF
jgi:putative transposase